MYKVLGIKTFEMFEGNVHDSYIGKSCFVKSKWFYLNRR